MPTRRLAVSIGVAHLIKLITVLKEQPTGQTEARKSLAEARQQLSNHILLALLDVAGAAAEVRCEKERADHLADFLQETRNTEIRQLTIAAIISGALFGFLSGGLFLAGAATAGTASSIAGGVVQTVFGSVALSQERRHRFQHRRNILGEVWESPEQPMIIPHSVWRFLNQPIGDDPQHRSLRETLVLRWRQEARLGRSGSQTERRRIALFFGEGGVYEIGELRARATMLALLEIGHSAHGARPQLADPRGADGIDRTIKALGSTNSNLGCMSILSVARRSFG
jgi:hypothetical protein